MSTQHFQIREIPVEIVKKIKVQAILEDSVPSDIVRKIIIDHFEDKEKKAGNSSRRP